MLEICRTWVNANNVVKARVFALQWPRSIEEKDEYMEAFEKLIPMLRRYGVPGKEILQFLDFRRFHQKVIERSL